MAWSAADWNNTVGIIHSMHFHREGGPCACRRCTCGREAGKRQCSAGVLELQTEETHQTKCIRSTKGAPGMEAAARALPRLHLLRTLVLHCMPQARLPRIPPRCCTPALRRRGGGAARALLAGPCRPTAQPPTQHRWRPAPLTALRWPTGGPAPPCRRAPCRRSPRLQRLSCRRWSSRVPPSCEDRPNRRRRGKAGAW